MRVLIATVIVTLLGSYSLATGPIGFEFFATLTLLFLISLLGCTVSWLVWRISADFQPASARHGARIVAIAGLGATWASGFILYAFLPALALPFMLAIAVLTVPSTMTFGWFAGRMVDGPPSGG